jgi:ABC-type transporter Mla subunit MlaD
MRRILGIFTALLAAATVSTVGFGASENSGDEYLVRAYFDNASFLVVDEEVRIAGAKVGEIAEVGVTLEGEAAHTDGSDDPGKAIVVMRITDPGFQDWREDASCLVRPQSLLGEKFVECQATQPRAPGTEPPPELSVIPEGEPGEGQRFLPVENNGKAVDLDLINNIMREPYPDRFRLILNELGIGLATRGEDLEEIILRGNPALRETNELLALLKGQTDTLSNLAEDGAASLGPLARERDRLVGFINNATVAGQATAERTDDLEEGFQKMPAFFRELRLTMLELEDFAVQSTPVISDLGDAAPELTRSTKALGPFARGARVALISLGENAESAREDLVASQPVIEDLGTLAGRTEGTAINLDRLLTDFRENAGLENLMRFFFFGAGATNGFDSFGHFMRAIVPVNNCFDYKTNAEPSCDINFTRTFGRRSLAEIFEAQRYFYEPVDATAGEDPPDPADSESEEGRDSEAPEDAQPEPGSEASEEDQRALLDFLIGSGGSR